MIWKVSMLWAMLCGVVMVAAAPVCHAEESTSPGTQLPSVFLPAKPIQPAVDPWLETVEKRPAKQVTETPWYWRFMEGMAIGAATYNTRKQSDGRPQTPSTVKP